MRKIVVVLFFLVLLGCNGNENNLPSEWQEELLMQLDEVRRKHNLVEKELSDLKAQISKVKLEKMGQIKSYGNF